MSLYEESWMVNDGHPGSLSSEFCAMRLLTVQEVADTLKVSEKTVRRLIKRGDITAYKVGDRGQLRVKEAELERYVDSQRVPAGETKEQRVEPTESGE